MKTATAPSEARTSSTDAMAEAARRDVQLIQIGRRALGLDDDTYHAMLACLCDGKTSSKDLTPKQRQKVLDHMKARGFVVKPRPQVQDGLRADQGRKLRAMWWALADVGAVERPATPNGCAIAVEAWAKRQLSGGQHPLDALRFATGAQMDVLIESLKRWCRRVGAACD